MVIWNVILVVCIAATSPASGLASGNGGILGIIDISDIIHSFDHDKSISIFTDSQWQIKRSTKVTRIL